MPDKKDITLEFVGMIAKQGSSIHVNIPKKLHGDTRHFQEQKLDIVITVTKRV